VIELIVHDNFVAIDGEQVKILINFDLPVDMEGKADCYTYLHRIDRTGRFSKRGIVKSNSRCLRNFKEINGLNVLTQNKI
jgi:superfamily II DNA/RNA helicase